MRYLITGGSGTLGSELVRKLIKRGAERIVVYSRGEHRQQKLADELGVNARGDGSPVRFFIGDVRDRNRLELAMHGITHVIHAAALKVVPVGEYNPTEFIDTNVMGAKNVIEAAIRVGVKRVVGISTDKACGPVNLYGATKLCAEKALIAANAYGGGKTEFLACRYGNVTGSQGSVVPLWLKMARGESRDGLPVTNPSMTRFWMTPEGAVDFVLRCTDAAEGGGVYVPMLKAYDVGTLAEAVWTYAGRKGLPVHEVMGVRAGEKAHESMISLDESPWCYEQPDEGRYVLMDRTPNRPVNTTKTGRFIYSSDLAGRMSKQILIHELEELGL